MIEADPGFVAEGFDLLGATVLELERAGVYRDLDAIRGQHRQLYLDLVGDSAHALHALQLREGA